MLMRQWCVFAEEVFETRHRTKELGIPWIRILLLRELWRHGHSTPWVAVEKLRGLFKDDYLRGREIEKRVSNQIGRKCLELHEQDVAEEQTVRQSTRNQILQMKMLASQRIYSSRSMNMCVQVEMTHPISKKMLRISSLTFSKG